MKVSVAAVARSMLAAKQISAKSAGCGWIPISLRGHQPYAAIAKVMPRTGPSSRGGAGEASRGKRGADMSISRFLLPIAITIALRKPNER